MQYLKSFTLATESDETNFLFDSPLFDMSCYNQMTAYPFQIFPFKGLRRLDFAPVTIIYGGNGSGKSTLLNIIAEKLGLHRSAPFNNSHLMEHYLGFCSYEMYDGTSKPPRGSEIITSDGVFDLLLDVRAMNRGIDRKREDLFDEYRETIKDCQDNGYQMRSLDDYDELKRRNEARRVTKTQYVARRLGAVEHEGKSNGESAFGYFTHKIKENALYLLDEPENSLSATLQARLADFLSDSARFYGCQFIISTHSPFLLSMKGAKIYDLDATPVAVRTWSELENVRAYFELFDGKRGEFE
ncbi:MAG: AAA family ATPase [Ruminococcaceae bacterium]|nr:AAA family ATPase [Oscillospiraceae bacterium]